MRAIFGLQMTVFNTYILHCSILVRMNFEKLVAKVYSNHHIDLRKFVLRHKNVIVSNKMRFDTELSNKDILNELDEHSSQVRVKPLLK